MSLIADALKAAQGERTKQKGGSREDMARRVLARPGGRERRETISWPLSSRRVPRQLGVAAGVFVVSLLAVVVVVVAAPSSRSAEDGGAVTSALSGGAAVPAQLGSALLADGGTADAGGLAEADPWVGESPAEAPALPARRGGLAEPYEDEAPFPSPPAAAAAAEAFAVPPAAADPQAAPGRFELKVEGAQRPAQSLFADAVAAHRRRDFAGAVQLYERVVAESPSHAEAFNNLGSAHEALGQFAAARDAFRRALALEPRYAAAWSNLGVVLSRLGENGEAQAALAEALRLEPNNHGVKVNLALQFQERGMTADALRLLKEVVASRPELAEAHYALAGLLERQGDVAGALRHYQLFLATANGRLPQSEALVRQRIQSLESRAGGR